MAGKSEIIRDNQLENQRKSMIFQAIYSNFPIAMIHFRYSRFIVALWQHQQVRLGHTAAVIPGPERAR
jgi:hypothetical protein